MKLIKEEEQSKLSIFLDENSEILEKYQNLAPELDEKTNKYFLKFKPKNLNEIIKILNPEKGKNVTYKAICEIAERYGYTSEIPYLSRIFNVNPGKKEAKERKKLKVPDSIIKQVELFKVMFKTHKECYVRIRNKKTEKYYAYKTDSLTDPYKLQQIIKKLGNEDLMYTLNAFNNMKSADEKSLFSLQNIALDIDFDTQKYSKKFVLSKIEELIKLNQLLTPNLIEHGHRVRLIYSIEDVPKTGRSLFMIKSVSKELNKLIPVEFNSSVQPCTTYGRMHDSINTKTGDVVKTNLVRAAKYTLRELQERYYVKIEKAEPLQKNTGNVINLWNKYRINKERLRDFEKIQKYKGDDCRKRLCFLFRNYCLLLNMTPQEALDATLKFNNNFRNPLKVNELDSDTKFLNMKNEQYKYKSKTILDFLEISFEDEIEMNLIVTKSNEKRNKNRRDKYKENLKKIGKQNKDEKKVEKKEKIKELYNKGIKQQKIAELTGYGIATVKRYVKEIKLEK